MRLFLAVEVLIMHFQTYFHYKEFFLISPVPIFLTISGYLVLSSYARSSSWFQFAWKRLVRIIPPLLCSFLLVLVLFGTTELGNCVVYYLTCGLRQMGGHIGEPVNGPLWSLGTEEIFYVVLALLYAMGGYKAKWPIWFLAIASFLTAFALSRRVVDPVVLRYTFLPVTFFCGNLAYLYKEKLTAAMAYPLIGFSILATVVCPMLHLPSAWAMVPAAFGVIAFGTKVKPVIKRLPLEISYGLYIYHMPVLWFFGRKNLSPAMFVVCTVVGSVVICVISRIFIEEPALKLKKWGAKPHAEEAVPTVQPALS